MGAKKEKWIIDIEEVGYSNQDLKDSVALLGEFQTTYNTLMQQIIEENSGQFIDMVKQGSDEEIDIITDIVADGNILTEAIDNYLQKIEEVNPWTGANLYLLKTKTVEDAVADTKKIFEREITENTKHTNNMIDEMNNRISRYNDVNSSINIPVEYKDDESTQSYIQQRRGEISQDKSDYNYNLQLIQESNDLMITLTSSLQELI